MQPIPHHSKDPHHDHRWLILGLIGTAQLLVVLDVTIVNIALPSAQRDLGFSDEDRQWVVTAYALAFGSLLLLGGRIADLFGRKWTFVVGLLGFASASALGGAAGSFELLVGARALQGTFGALLAPAALSLLTTTFTQPAERAKAFGVFGAIAGMGGAFGLLLGGVLTEVLDWRWCLYVSIVFAVPAAVASVRLLQHAPAPSRPRLDIPGTLVASSGLFSLVLGLARAESDGWGSPVTLGFLAASTLLLVTFVALQRRTEHPLLPLRVVADRDRGGSFLALGTAGAGIFAVFLFLTFYLQQTKGLSALETGLAFLPMTFAIVVSATIASTRLLVRTGPRPLVPTGMLGTATGLVLLTRIGVDTAYVSHVLPSLILVGLGFGFIVAPAFATATAGVGERDSGVASAMADTSQQIGGAIGTALLSTLAVAASTNFASERGQATELLRQAAVEGYVTAFWWGAGIFVVGAVVCGSLLRSIAHPAIAETGLVDASSR
ncbi:MAG: DHA2 family efflux MFS transporter permease subunit [Propionibacteriales bacterium]|nr:DHA2 family efflux MFS transporter permease subunit [Propionibacteriales bacterium]